MRELLLLALVVPAIATTCGCGGRKGIFTTNEFAYVVNSSSNNVSGYSINLDSGTVTSTGGAAVVVGNNPVSVAATPSDAFLVGPFLYALNAADATVSGFSIDAKSGRLTAIAGSPFPVGGSSPAQITIDPKAQFLFVANTGSNDVSVLHINSSNGALTAVNGSPFAITGTIVTNPTGPSALAVDPSSSFLFVADNLSGQVSAYTIGSTGALTIVSGSPFTAGVNPTSVVVDNTGKFLYVANHGDHTISSYNVTPGTGALITLVTTSGTGTDAAALATDSAGRLYVANDVSNSVSVFSINGTTGALIELAGSPFAAGGTGASFVSVDPHFAPPYTSKFLFAANTTSNNVTVFSIGGGVLMPVQGSPFASSGIQPSGITSVQLTVAREGFSGGPF